VTEQKQESEISEVIKNHIKTFSAEQIRVLTHKSISSEEANRMPPQVFMSLVHGIRDNMLLEISAYFAGLLDHKIDIEESYPADWWQAFKDRWFPKWLLRKYPVQCREIIIHKKIYRAVCPHVHADPPATHLRWLAEETWS